MKFTYNWLKDFVEIHLSPEQLADKLTMAGIEVGSIEEKGGDFVFEIEITSNRPDWLSVVGIAREVAALIGSKVRILGSQSHKITKSEVQKFRRSKSKQLLEIEIEDKKDCPLYTAKIIRDVKVGPSPDWIRKRLELIDCRSINNVVDITNYVLFTYGEPLHAFDVDKLFMCQGVRVSGGQDQIIVRRAKNGEKIVTIDGQEKQLDNDILVIANSQNPVAIAGIMGGKDTEVSGNTKNILLEAAIFNPVVIRRGRQKLGMQSDASYRFERGVDSETVKNSSTSAVRLLEELAEAKCTFIKDAGSTKIKPKVVNLSLAAVTKVLGVNIPQSRVKSILRGLGFNTVIKGKNNFVVTVPAYRQDVSAEIDLIEEIARIFGYDQISATLPAVHARLNISGLSSKVTQIKNILVGLGLNEAITYTLMDRDILKEFDLSYPQLIEVQNPLSKEQEILRPTIIPSLARSVAFNLNQKQDCVKLFEVANIFPGADFEAPGEELALGMILCGEKSTLLETGVVKDKMGVLHLKGIIETLFERLGLKNISFRQENPWQVLVYSEAECLGTIVKLKKNILDSMEIKNKEVVAAEIDLSKVFSQSNSKKSFSPIYAYPGIFRDLSLLLKNEVKIEEVFGLIKESAGGLLRQVKVTDVYKGKQIAQGFKSITVSCLYLAQDRTLTEEEINPIHSCVSKTLVNKLGAQIR